ncbi:MAG TPA: hypothetical protein VLS44_03080 [Nitrospira sp.]|nr:hypothetical protein [Nitrospira sp.]
MKGPMYREEKTFTLQFSLEASFPDDYEGDDDHQAWTREWETRMKPDIIKVVFESLRRHPGWSAHIRNRGKSAQDEIEVALERDFTTPQPFRI